MKEYILSLLAILLIFYAISVVLRLSKKQKMKQAISTVEHDLRQKRKKADEDPPELKRIRNLIEKHLETKDPAILVEIGDIYQKGAYPRFKSNPKKAQEYYTMAANNIDRNVARIANNKIIEASYDPIHEVDNLGEELTDFYIAAIEATLLDNFINEEPRTTTEIINELFAQEANRPQYNNNAFLNDQQNVHDHYMNKIVQKNIDKLKETHIETNKDIKHILIEKSSNLPDLSWEQKARINKVINSLSNAKTQFSATEQEVASLVYNHIKDNDDLVRNFFLQLADSYLEGHIVCSTGKIARMVAVVGDTEEFADSKNIHYIKQELQTLAAKVRDDHLATLSQQEIDSYNNGTNNRIVEDMQKKYVEIVKQEYCQKLNVDYPVIHAHVESNMIHF